MKIQIALKICGTLLITTVLAAQATDAPAKKQPNPLAKEYMEKHGHGEGKLQPGDIAPDFNLKKQSAADRIRLSAYKGNKPVALIFGSLT